MKEEPVGKFEMELCMSVIGTLADAMREYEASHGKRKELTAFREALMDALEDLQEEDLEDAQPEPANCSASPCCQTSSMYRDIDELKMRSRYVLESVKVVNESMEEILGIIARMQKNV